VDLAEEFALDALLRHRRQQGLDRSRQTIALRRQVLTDADGYRPRSDEERRSYCLRKRRPYQGR
jgi:hypothetical protein